MNQIHVLFAIQLEAQLNEKTATLVEMTRKWEALEKQYTVEIEAEKEKVLKPINVA